MAVVSLYIYYCSSSYNMFFSIQDICVMCGSLGNDLEGRLICCGQCGQCYHPHCVNVKVIYSFVEPLFCSSYTRWKVMGEIKVKTELFCNSSHCLCTAVIKNFKAWLLSI